MSDYYAKRAYRFARKHRVNEHLIVARRIGNRFWNIRQVLAKAARRDERKFYEFAIMSI